MVVGRPLEAAHLLPVTNLKEALCGGQINTCIQKAHNFNGNQSMQPFEFCLTSLRSGAMAGVRTSLCRIMRSLEPELSMSPFQARAPTRAEWPSRQFTRLLAATSQTWEERKELGVQ